ncbi:histidinol-phosphate transaminase [Lysobacter sp. F6437]|uniref:histidinol-phosphate transaminase n=1 Tax=Lysobacter sp. F6437 TaxID=3459296 RepID=UPI00403E0E79
MSASPLGLIRPDLRDFTGYASARSVCLSGQDVSSTIWLNANESPWPNRADSAAQLRRYPDPQPAGLLDALAELYGCTPAQLLVGRGSDEGIDLLVRALCRPGADAVVTTPPTFGMYAVSARLHGTAVLEAPLIEGVDGFTCDMDAVARAAEDTAARLVFLCSPGNPCGNVLPLASIGALAQRLQEQAVVVVDEAYLEYGRQPSAVTLIPRQRNIAVLRTLSKAHALAAARVGCVVADPELVLQLRRCQAPYPLPEPCVALAEQALDPQARAATASRIATVVAERGRLAAALAASPWVRQVYPSDGNFLLVRFFDLDAAFARLLAAGIVVRGLAAVPGLEDALRITVGSPVQNAGVIRALASPPAAVGAGAA